MVQEILTHIIFAFAVFLLGRRIWFSFSKNNCEKCGSCQGLNTEDLLKKASKDHRFPEISKIK